MTTFPTWWLTLPYVVTVQSAVWESFRFFSASIILISFSSLAELRRWNANLCVSVCVCVCVCVCVWVWYGVVHAQTCSQSTIATSLAVQIFVLFVLQATIAMVESWERGYVCMCACVCVCVFTVEENAYMLHVYVYMIEHIIMIVHVCACGCGSECTCMHNYVQHVCVSDDYSSLPRCFLLTYSQWSSAQSCLW